MRNILTEKKRARETHNISVRARNLERCDIHDRLRIAIADIYLRGEGLEIGGLHKPLNIPEDKAKVKYVDRLSVEELKAQYPEITEPMVDVHYVDDGEKLTKIKSSSQDFLVACHFYEHCADPIQTLKNLLRVVKPGGGLFIVVPDKRYTFDIKRPITPFKHIIADHEKGPEHSKLKHFKEWVREVEGLVDADRAQAKLKELLDMDYSIHYHVWDYDATVDYFIKAKQYLNNVFDIELVARNLSENIIYLTKASSQKS